jgi:hypothetical protein
MGAQTRFFEPEVVFDGFEERLDQPSTAVPAG